MCNLKIKSCGAFNDEIIDIFTFKKSLKIDNLKETSRPYFT